MYNLKKIWVDQGFQFYNKPMNPWLHENGITFYSAYKERKSVAAERFVTTLKCKSTSLWPCYQKCIC